LDSDLPPPKKISWKQYRAQQAQQQWNNYVKSI
jgi:hypothetical protein